MIATFLKNNISKAILLFSIILSAVFCNISIVHADTNAVNGKDYGVVLEASSRELDKTEIQRVKLAIKSGKYNNSTFETTFKQPTANIKRDLQKGDVVLVALSESSSDSNAQTIEIVDFYRVPNIFWAPILFILIFLIVVIVKYKRKLYIFFAILIASVGSMLLIVFLKVNFLICIIPLFSISLAFILFIIYRKLYISLIGLLIPIITGIGAFALTFLTLQLGQVQLSYLTLLNIFYDLTSSDYYESFYTGVLLSSIIGSVYIAFNQILESVRLKVSQEGITKKELTVKSFKHTIKNFDWLTFPMIGFLLGIMASVFIFLQRSIGLEAALNNDFFVSLSVISFVSLIMWTMTVPVCALLCGVILGRLEQHKVITDKTISIIE